MATTDRYGFKRLGPGESLADDGYQFTDADRVLMDRLLYLGAEAHRHDGVAAGSATTPAAPSLALLTTGGALPAGTRVYYKVSLVDVNGLESAGSPEAYVDTPKPIIEPGPPTLSAVFVSGGSLPPGNYYYVLSAYTNGVDTQETKALSPAFVTVAVPPSGTAALNTIRIVFPALPAGATGWNVYRKRPGGARYDYLLSSGPVASIFDTGAAAENCNRTTPVRNSTNGQNSVRVTMGGATPNVPVGSTWKLYRTFISGSFNNSLLHHVVENTSEGSGIITPLHTDVGLATRAGKPPTVGVTMASPAKLKLGNSAEVQGALPLARVSAFPEMVTFSFEGQVGAPRQGTSTWVCEYPNATIMGVRASLGRGSTPAASDVVVDVNHGPSGATPTYTSIFTVAADQPRVLVAQQRGARVVPTALREVREGDVLTVDIDTEGGGATPTDRDLVVVIYLLVWGYTSDLSHVPVFI